MVTHGTREILPCKRYIRVIILSLQEITNYQFDCKPTALQPALDRFAQFFLAPLCKEDALQREVSAVDNEFAGADMQIPFSSPGFGLRMLLLSEDAAC